MLLLFKEVYANILRIEENLNERKFSLKDSVFNLGIGKLFLLALKIDDNDLLFEISNFLRSSSLEDFNRVISLFKKRKDKYLRKKIFVVFGRNKRYLQIVKNCIQKSGFEFDFLDTTNTFVGSPIILPTLIERISSSFKVLVIASADNEGRRIGSDNKLTARPRLNVVLEAGLSYGILDMHNVLLLWDKRVSIARITDLQGILRIDIEEDEKKASFVKDMEKIIELFLKKDQMISFEEKSYWREELLYLLQSKGDVDLLVQEMINILKLLIFRKVDDALENSLVQKFNLFLKYLNKPKEVWQSRVLDLIDLSKEYFSEKHKVSVFDNDYFCSRELSNWAQELYYLMGKLEKRSGIVEKTLELLKKARVALIKEDKIELDKNLRIFILIKRRYIDIIV